MVKTATTVPATAKPDGLRVVALRGFHVDASNMLAVVATRTYSEDLVLTQGNQTIKIPKVVINAFKRAVADIADIGEVSDATFVSRSS